MYAGAGLKLNYFISGIQRNKRTYEKIGDPSDVDRDMTLNPFDNKDFSLPACRWNGGLIFESGINLNKKLNLEITYTTGQYITYGNKGSMLNGWEGSLNRYSNDDFSLTLKYRLTNK